MEIDIEKTSGFCFGVQNAINLAEKALAEGEKVYCLGQIVHNELEVERLNKLGLITIDYDRFRNLKDCKVLIRAHGEPPETYATAQRNNIDIIEATCPIVKKLQGRVAGAGNTKEESQVAIYGKQGHAEVRGLLGQAGDKAILIGTPSDISKIDYAIPLTIFSQTTMRTGNYLKITEAIKDKYREYGKDPANMLKVVNSICGQVSNRGPAVRDFARAHDIILFVSGKNSSNGKMLYQECLEANSASYFITSFDEIDPAWFTGKSRIGISGATSTPRWLINEISEKLQKIIS